MDESWRAPLGWLVLSCGSPDQPTDIGRSLKVNDFLDVFGGPPPSVLRRELCGGGGGDLTSVNSSSCYELLRHDSSFYDEVFQPPPVTYLSNAGRQLPNFTIPAAGPCAGVAELPSKDSAGDDDDDRFSSFMSRLRPIAVPLRRGDWPSPPSAGGGQDSAAASCFTRRRAEGCAAVAWVLDGCFRLFCHDHPSQETAEDRKSCSAEEERDFNEGSGGSDYPYSVISSVYDDIPMSTIRPAKPRDAAAAALGRMATAATVATAEEEETVVGATERETAGAEWCAALDDAIAWAKEKSIG